MEKIVIDASVGIKWFKTIDEKYVDYALKINDLRITDRVSILVPDLFFLEILNAFFTNPNYNLKDIIDIEKALYYMNLEIAYPDHQLLNDMINISDISGLTVYDSFYIAVAQKYEAHFITCDKKVLNNKNRFHNIWALEELDFLL